MAKHFNKLGKGDTIPKVDRTAQPDTTKVQMADWTILAKVDGSRTLEEIIASVSMAEKTAVASLLRLRELGMIELPQPAGLSSAGSIRKSRPSSNTSRSVKKEKKVKKTSVRIPYPTNWPIAIAQFMFDPMDLDQDVELEMEKRRQVLYYHYHLKRVSYYDLFQVLVTADKRDIRKAYFKLSKEFHPDLFFRKEMGGFQRRVEELFQWISKAYSILKNDNKRKQYDAMLKRGLLGPWQLADATAASARKPSTRMTPRPQPRSGSGNKAVQRSNVLVSAKQAEKKGQWERALVLYKSQLKTTFDAGIAHRAARCLLELDRDLVEAEAMCRRALSELKERGRRAEILLTLAKVLESTQRSAESRELYTEVLKLDPTHPVARMQLERLSRVT